MPPGRGATIAMVTPMAGGTRPACERPAAALFDLDGTLIHSGAAVEETWRAWARARGLQPDAVLRAVHGRRTEDVVAALLPGVDTGAEAARVEAGIVAAGAEAVGPMCELYRRLAPERRAIVTSGLRATAAAHLRTLGLEAPATLVTAADVRVGKPDPQPYLFASARLGVPPAACLVLEDAPLGVQAARAAGMPVIAVTTTHAADELRAAGAELAVDPAAARDAALRRMAPAGA